MHSAMILAAGRGERMADIGKQTHKCLLSVGGKPLIAYHLENLAAIGIKHVVINLRHLAEQIQQTLGDGSNYGLRISYSLETRELDTGGGIKNALPLLGDAPFILLSADVWSDYPLQQLALPTPQWAHIVLTDNAADHPRGDFSLTNHRELTETGESKYTYASIGVLNPAVFAMIPAETFGLAQVFRQAIANQRATGEYYSGQVINVNTPNTLAKLDQLLTTG